MKQMEVTIMGQSYLLGCPEGGEAALAEAVSQVDREMCAIRDGGKVKARERIAVLAALNLAYQLAEDGDRPAPATSSVQAQADVQAAEQALGRLPDLEGLMRRLDEALDHDGHLL
ncbi:cell division protein ZapA [Paucibacter sp. KBW04]|uniref:cell division protein ZapA n=1 Tax=Paucibacter sp. KBW04 TaxID=2153361 RepID=UPI000F588928|nr:cell division protein ZapA [Paucibacter sp. KBW04]RQO58525.1 cell division protein ZapA [Paucibacter sp. KBW04]